MDQLSDRILRAPSRSSYFIGGDFNDRLGKQVKEGQTVQTNVLMWGHMRMTYNVLEQVNSLTGWKLLIWSPLIRSSRALEADRVGRRTLDIARVLPANRFWIPAASKAVTDVGTQ